MKKLLGIVVQGLLWCNVGIANDGLDNSRLVTLVALNPEMDDTLNAAGADGVFTNSEKINLCKIATDWITTWNNINPEYLNDTNRSIYDVGLYANRPDTAKQIIAYTC